MSPGGGRKVIYFGCEKCRNSGYRLPVLAERRFKDLIPYGVLFRDGIACTCKAGRQFAAWQAQYHGVTPDRAPVVEIRTV